MPDAVIRAQQVQTAPAGYTVPLAQEIVVKSVRALVDGTNAASAFLATLQLVAADGSVVWEAPTDSTIAAGGSANVSWFPRVATSQFQPNTGGKWLPYNVIFSAAGGGAAIGNGTIAAIYLQLGALVMVKIRMVFGTTSTFGAGLFQWTLPVTAVATPAIGGVSGDCVDNSAAADFVSFGFVTGTTVLNSFAHQLSGVGGNVQFMTASTPIVWAVDDICTVAAIYQASV
jgi:hypothetical protein